MLRSCPAQLKPGGRRWIVVVAVSSAECVMRVQALGLRPEDVFTTDMLALAVEEDSERFREQLRLGG